MPDFLNTGRMDSHPDVVGVLALVIAVISMIYSIGRDVLDRRGQCRECPHPRSLHALHFALHTPTCRAPGCGCES